MTSSTDPVHQFLQSLEETRGDTRAQAALTAEFLLMTRSEAEREPLRDALDAATVLRWFDDDLLRQVLEIPTEEARRRSEVLNSFSFVERYQRGEEEVCYIHEATRLGWRHKLSSRNPDRFRTLSLRAASCFAADGTPAGRIEWVYHLMCGDPDVGASKLEELDRQWSTNSRSEDRYALATALQELENTQHLQGRARAWSVLWIARTRVMRGEAGELAGVLAEVLKLAGESGDKSAQADAMRFEGEVRQAQGDLTAAQAAFGESIAISRRLVEEDPGNALWQRGLAVTLGRTGDLLRSHGKLKAAQEAFEESLAISQRLAEQDPNDVGWQRDLAIAHGRMVPVQIFQRHPLFGKLSESEIHDLLADSRVERYPAGREIFAKGSPGASIIAVLRGTVKMSAVSPEGKEIVFQIINPGEIFGEIGALDGEERSADAVAMTDCELLAVHRQYFLQLLEKRPDLSLILLRILSRRLRQTSEQVEDVMFRHLESRVAKALLHLAESAGLRRVQGASIELHVSQRELGAMAGGSRESVNKILQNWHRQGIIDLGKASLLIRDTAALERLI
jgi:CRP/FNR family cyclic AMP-dependent transcriptional regulator